MNNTGFKKGDFKKSDLKKGNLKSSIFAASLLSIFSASTALAETKLLELNGETSFDLYGSTDYTFNIQLDQPYSEITKACLTIETNDENLSNFPSPGSLAIKEKSEFAPIEAELLTAFVVTIGYQIIDPDTGTVEISKPSISDPQVCLGMTRQNLEDGFASIDLRLSGDVLSISSLKFEIEGTPSDLLMSLVNRSNTMFYPAEGGEVIYDFSLGNYFDEYERRVFRMWSVVTMPDGSPYPDKLPAGFALNYGEIRAFEGKKFKIPHWFPGGSYTLTWYVSDNTDTVIHKKSLTFFKKLDMNL